MLTVTNLSSPPPPTKLYIEPKGAQRVAVDTKYETDKRRVCTKRERQIEYRERSFKRTKGTQRIDVDTKYETDKRRVCTETGREIERQKETDRI